MYSLQCENLRSLRAFGEDFLWTEFPPRAPLKENFYGELRNSKTIANWHCMRYLPLANGQLRTLDIFCARGGIVGIKADFGHSVYRSGKPTLLPVHLSLADGEIVTEIWIRVS